MNTNPIQGELIWKAHKPYNLTPHPDPEKTRLEFPHLIRFKDAWYCAFHEGEVHDNHPSGKGRIIRSLDGKKWETSLLLEWDGGDVREPRFSITAEGNLLVSASINFVSNEAREDGYHYQLDRKTLGMGLVPHNDNEAEVALQSVTWLSSDGENWSTAYADLSGTNTRRYDVTWHNGMGYSISNAVGKDKTGTLYRTRDGKSWRALLSGFIPPAQSDEGDLAFGEDGTAYCLLRGNKATRIMLGIGKPPYYQEWEWKNPQLDWNGDGALRPVGEVLRVELGGPEIIRLKDGRFLGAGRTLGPERPDGPWRVDPSDSQGKEDGRVTLFWIDAHKCILTKFIDIDGTSYPGLVEHDGRIWVSYLVWWGDKPGIYLANVKL